MRCFKKWIVTEDNHLSPIPNLGNLDFGLVHMGVPKSQVPLMLASLNMEVKFQLFSLKDP